MRLPKICLLVLAVSLIAAGNVSPTELLARSVESFNALETYSLTLRSYGLGKNKQGEIIKYQYAKPGFVRMDFISPHKGAFLIYNPETGKALLRPFGLLKPLVVTLSPSNKLILSTRGHQVDASDLGSLLRNVSLLLANGSAVVDEATTLGDREVIPLSVTGEGGFEVDEINNYRLWIDAKLLLPIKVEGYGLDGTIIEGVLMEDLMLNIKFDDELFTP